MLSSMLKFCRHIMLLYLSLVFIGCNQNEERVNDRIDELQNIQKKLEESKKRIDRISAEIDTNFNYGSGFDSSIKFKDSNEFKKFQEGEANFIDKEGTAHQLSTDSINKAFIKAWNKIN